MDIQTGTSKPGIVEGEVELDGVGGRGLAIAVVHPPAPRGQQVLHTEVVPLVGICSDAFVVQHRTISEVEAGDEGKFVKGTLLDDC